MKRLWALCGQLGYILAYPALRIYLKNTHRSRVIVKAEGKVLLVKDWLGTGEWKLPGGGIHAQEDPAISAQRELAEETSLQVPVEQLIPLGIVPTKSHGVSVTLHVYGLTFPSPQAIKPQHLEIIEAAWLPLSQIATERLSTNTKLIIERFDKL